MRYVLEGSVQRDANRVRVNAQLIDAEAGAHLWADRFDEDVVDLFELQDEVVARLARTLQVELVSAEAQRSLHDHSQNPDAIDLTMRGSALLDQPLHESQSLRDPRLIRASVGFSNPTDADALAGAAFVDRRTTLSVGPTRVPSCMRGRRNGLTKLLLLDPDQAGSAIMAGRA